MRGGGKVYDEEGKEIPGGGKGYRYLLGFPSWFRADADRLKIFWPSTRATRCERNVRSEAKIYREALGEPSRS